MPSIRLCLWFACVNLHQLKTGSHLPYAYASLKLECSQKSAALVSSEYTDYPPDNIMEFNEMYSVYIEKLLYILCHCSTLQHYRAR